MSLKENVLDANELGKTPTKAPKAINYAAPKSARFINFSIDLGILYSAMLLIRLVADFYHLDVKSPFISTTKLAILLLYHPFLEYSYGKTIGKILTKTVVVSKDGKKITLTQAIVRGLFKLNLPIVFLFLIQKKPTTWFDRASETVVVKGAFLDDYRKYYY